jgi:hypothetical protein
MRLAEMSSMGIGNKPCLDIRPSADQISDRSISIAQLSKSKFFKTFVSMLIGWCLWQEALANTSRRQHGVLFWYVLSLHCFLFACLYLTLPFIHVLLMFALRCLFESVPNLILKMLENMMLRKIFGFKKVEVT